LMPCRWLPRPGFYQDFLSQPWVLLAGLEFTLQGVLHSLGIQMPPQ
jgi:hypothetical protein